MMNPMIKKLSPMVSRWGPVLTMIPLSYVSRRGIYSALFPNIVIAFGRSDSNGQIHLISVAIVSDEKTETYTHFYRYLIGIIHLIG